MLNVAGYGDFVAAIIISLMISGPGDLPFST